MKMHLERGEGMNVIRGYKAGQITINEAVYSESLIVMPNQLITDWRAASFQDLRQEDFQALANLNPELVLLGTGKKLRFPPPALAAPLHVARIGMEVMDTAAACRTYNFLMAEGRNVAAALLF